ncbi:acetolactate synthase, catabolic [Cladophialophora bantiana CBS 173.52]|uniref:Acetolactate synthase, catabolic n=1 Tax=Cladophialophora bantiana (strain ATCC 10958 / CBS 173.52 / CDC B-1940 / NIH 8579) TaxID=1442370 RepID=A0A0D2HI02_CLAB1|nr:acetolactate synthase, catabolic [Cladophialophora bantiana CBS 173.52]KIW90410.1 acetolactate synthase, catabolic [Cladophialophora bantiana CBS 173.52]
MSGESTVAQIIVNSLYNAGVRLVFGVPGAKIDAIFDGLMDHPEIKLIVARHEQNAAFMAAAVGRITGIPGVCIGTSGPGSSNLATGLITATTENDPVLALLGSVPRHMNLKRTHQSMRALDILGPTAKTAVGIDIEDQAAEAIVNAFRSANAAPKGAAVISIPQDVAKGTSKILPFPSDAFVPPMYGPAPLQKLDQVVQMIESAKLPVLFLGMRASSPKVVSAVRRLLSKFPLPTVETFQAAGAVPKELVHLFYGRVGLFRNQVGDKLLSRSDLVLAVGYDPVEYDANLWNPHGTKKIVHIDFTASDYGTYYHPVAELLGSVVENVTYLSDHLSKISDSNTISDLCRGLIREYTMWQERPEVKGGSSSPSGKVHPLHFISTLQGFVSKDTTICVDVGSVYIYFMRYFFAYEPRRLLTSDGQQTLGIALPWAIASSLTQSPPCSEKVISISGDGGFMFSSQEMSTAVQQGCNITHFIWNDEAYNMVEFQEVMKYGRASGVALGGVDFVKFAESFGAKGFRIETAEQVEDVLQKALAYEGVSVVDVNIDYSENAELAKNVIADEWN